MAAYRQGLDQIDIKSQGMWTNDTFWQYVTSSCAATSPVAAGLACAVQATMPTMSATSSTSFKLSHPPLHSTVNCNRQTSSSIHVSQTHELPAMGAVLIFCPDCPQTVWSQSPLCDTNPCVSAQTTKILSGVSVRYPRPWYISLLLPRSPINCLVPVSDMCILFFVVL